MSRKIRQFSLLKFEAKTPSPLAAVTADCRFLHSHRPVGFDAVARLARELAADGRSQSLSGEDAAIRAIAAKLDALRGQTPAAIDTVGQLLDVMLKNFIEGYERGLSR